MYDAIIIGGGPAGLTAGIYTARARLKTLLVENPLLASQTSTTALIENYPGFPEGIDGPALIERMKQQVLQLGAEFVTDEVKYIKAKSENRRNIWTITLSDKYIDTLSIIIAAGAKPKQLNVQGEDKFKGKGISYCATCDGAFFRGKEIAVVGGGDTAIEEALFLTRFAEKIIIIHRRDKLRAAKILQERVLNNDNIIFRWDSILKEISGKDKVEKVKIENVKTKKESEIPCSGVFIFAGYIPNTEIVKGIVELDNEGYIITDDNMNTSKEGMFACGDCRKKLLRQVVTACGDGATAAFSCQAYLEKIKGTV